MVSSKVIEKLKVTTCYCLRGEAELYQSVVVRVTAYVSMRATVP